MPIFVFIDAFLSAFFVTILLIPIVKKLAVKWDALDYPGNRKIHDEPIPRLGGLGIYLGFVITLIFVMLVYRSYELWPLFKPIIIGASLIILVGLIDDVKGMRPPIKLFFQIIIAMIIVSMGIRIDFISNPFGGILYLPAFLAWIVTLFWIVGITNTINLIDGVDGLAAGVTLIAASTMFIVAILLKRYEIAILAIALAGATLGFLKFNFTPASIFMGDTGSMLLGFILACISVLGVLKSAATLALAIPLLALGIPIMDTLAAILRRVKNKRHIFKADDQHLHHRLLMLGFSQRQVVWVIYYVSIILSIGALFITLISGLWAFIFLLTIIFLIYFGIRKIKRMELI
ncbi:MAG: undecaprenyl/decaprenyl-phosphate alpha-N-acetylglucosaminyl 1-phosphate transferase [Candidatus Margulisbacteria bacterium]|nr:undecaprenyl/decaprenyl-phosphate alpha-N-acetylglucosaminyl 1-phosphate transferase [Candidatus Margulisiibacteriota bacterium]